MYLKLMVERLLRAYAEFYMPLINIERVRRKEKDGKNSKGKNGARRR
jgi:hypothetical protein